MAHGSEPDGPTSSEEASSSPQRIHWGEVKLAGLPLEDMAPRTWIARRIADCAAHAKTARQIRRSAEKTFTVFQYPSVVLPEGHAPL